MVKPILYYVDVSPPSRAVLLTLKELGVEFDSKIINLLTLDHLKPEFVKLNPYHTIPVLDDNGVIISDSHAIISYLADKYGKTDSLYPKDIVARARVNQKLYFDTGFLFCRYRFLVEPILYHGSTEWPQYKIDYMAQPYELLEASLKASQTNYIAGDNLTIADFSIISSISSIETVVPVDQTKFPLLYAYKLRIEALPYYHEANQVGSDLLGEAIQTRLAENRKKAGN